MSHTPPLNLGFIPIARPTFDIPLAQEVTARVRNQLQQAGFNLVGPAESLITNGQELQAALPELTQQPPDMLLVMQATFADSAMALELAQAVDAPLLLWAIPEERTGGRLRLNSLCGINLAGHALTRAGYRYDYIYAPPGDPAALEKVEPLARAGQVRRRLAQARLGRIGQHPNGFVTCSFNRETIKQQLGVDIVQVELDRIFEQAQATDPDEVETVYQELSTRLGNLAELEQESLRRTLASYLALRQLAKQENLHGLAVRCWPEFFTELGCAACGAMAMLNDEQLPCGCEADVNGTITQLILQWLSGEPAFSSDLVAVDTADDLMALWHCGLAPLSMADPAATPRATIHSNRNLPLLMEFPLKPGQVTIARLSEATGSYRLAVGTGEMIQAPMSFTGTSGVIRFDRPAAQLLDTILQEGLEHHFSLTYGNHMAALLALANMLDIPVLRL